MTLASTIAKGANIGRVAPIGDMTTMIRYEGEIAAFFGGSTRHLVPPFSELDPDDPVRRMVELMCAFALAYRSGRVPGAYSHESAARFARTPERS